jgi:hypothetical protein
MKSQLPGTADAAALAGALELPDPAATKNKVLEYVEKNMSERSHGSVLNADDVEAGN